LGYQCLNIFGAELHRTSYGRFLILERVSAIGVLNALDADIQNMPKYDYECPGEEVIMEFDLAFDHEPPACTTCGAKMRRVFTATPAIFKGRGWGAKP
jgi:putative FmdB family regulatory protein